ncbi:MAG: hypothetical protein SGBAC_008932 [Bacillariaceae sp.]
MIQTDNITRLESASLPSPTPIASSVNVQQSHDIPNRSILSVGRQLKRLRDSNTWKEAQTAILALLPVVHKWMQADSKQQQKPLTSALKGPPNNNTSRTSNNKTQENAATNSALRAVYAKQSSSTTITTTNSAGKVFQQLHGVSILVLAFKEWEDCPLVVAGILRLLALLVRHDASVGQGLIDLGGLRVIVRTISNKYQSKKKAKKNDIEKVVTAAVAFLSELAHMPSSPVASDACLALVVHSLWRFPKNGYLQGFGCLFLERVLRPKLFPASKSLPLDAVKKRDSGTSGSKDGDDEEEDTWSIATIHQPDTLQKVVIPLLIRMNKNHHVSNPVLCQTAKRLFQCIHDGLIRTGGTAFCY